MYADTYRWIIGKNCVHKVRQLDLRWKNECLKRYKKSSFSPWLSFDSEKIRNISDPLLSSNKVIIDSDFLKTLSLLCETGEDTLGELGVKGKSFEINSSIFNERPDIINEVSQATNLLFKVNPWLSELEKITVNHIVPIKINGRGKKAGFSSIKARGFIFYSFPRLNEKFNALDFAIDYAHEIGHQVLFRYQAGGNIFNGSHCTEIYSAIKNCNRPAIMTFHGSYALAYMKLITRQMLNSGQVKGDEIKFGVELLSSVSEKLKVTINEIVKSPANLTRLGKELFKELCEINRYTYEEN